MYVLRVPCCSYDAEDVAVYAAAGADARVAVARRISKHPQQAAAAPSHHWTQSLCHRRQQGGDDTNRGSSDRYSHHFVGWQHDRIHNHLARSDDTEAWDDW